MSDTQSAGAAFDVVGIGNALVDVLSQEGDGFVERMALVKGSMELVEDDRATALYDAMSHRTEMSGGSAANTLAGIASFGGRAAYIGRVFDDDLGTVFAHDLSSLDVTFTSPRATDGPPTGRCMIIVTPDAERTMSTYLGASSLLGPEHLDLSLVEAASVTFLEGYLYDRPEAKAAYGAAADAAHAAGRRVALSLSDSFCVERHLDDFRALVRDGVDILFANEEEALALFGVATTDEAVEAVRGQCEIACITRGAKGSLIVTADAEVEVAAEPVAKVVDTTGAGDLYAAGFLYGLTHGMDLARSGRLGSVAAAAVIGHSGARPGMSLGQLLSTLTP